MSLGLNRSNYVSSVVKEIRPKMMTPCDSLHGYEIVETIGLIEVVIEKDFAAASFHGIGAVQGGCLNEMVEDARFALARLAAERGANCVLGIRYVISGRDLEKSVLAYGFAAVSRPLHG